MTRTYTLKSGQTLSAVNALLDQGIKKISLLIRHSERLFSTEAGMEPFMQLTEAGKTYAYEFGRALRPEPIPDLSSSFMGRCIETACLIDKGFTCQHNTALPHNKVDTRLAPFYIKDIGKAVERILVEGNDLFIRNWFDGKIGESIIENPKKTADLICSLMIGQTQNLARNRIAISVTHDWNIYPVKEFKLGLRHEDCGGVGYLESILVFEKNNRYYITCYQTDPVELHPFK
ncbi:MAG: histidine phosphatase family protein [Desulfobacula sp. RIFOXYB2_FULL_45_6]|nr:MAG: histidine phosphatase family protein [Desulfobacula sp. RIFOXYB2_FULL_45_6]